jgi:hypothetical protein
MNQIDPRAWPECEDFCAPADAPPCYQDERYAKQPLTTLERCILVAGWVASAVLSLGVIGLLVVAVFGGAA